MSGAILGALICTRARLHLPPRGVWTATIEVPSDLPIEGPQTLIVGDLSLVGTVARSHRFAGVVTARIVGGAGGWSRVVRPLGEKNDAGVFLSLVAAKIAALAGEPIDLAFPERVLGTAWLPMAGPASQLLTEAAGADWHVGTDGIARIGRRLPSVALPVSIMSVDMASRIAMVASEEIATLMPGAYVPELPTPIEHVSHTVTPAGMRTELVLEAA